MSISWGLACLLMTLFVAGIALGFCGCATPAKLSNHSASYLGALEAALAMPTLPPGSPAADAALDRIRRMFEDFSQTNVASYVREVYDENVYLRDGFKELKGIETVAPYMIESAANAEHCTFTFEDASEHDGNYYLRWVMRVRLAGDPKGQMDEAVGMSHFRFNAAGKVVFQQDYWDPTDVLYKRIPVANWLIKLVKNRL